MPGRPPPWPPAGAPGRAPPSRPSRPAGGRGARSRSPPGAASPPPVRGAGLRPMPCVDENGLLPGRGAPGRAPPPPGRGAPGRAAVSPADAAAGFSSAGADFGAGFGPGLGPGRAPGVAAFAAGAAGASAAGASAAGAAAGFSGAGAGAAASGAGFSAAGAAFGAGFGWGLGVADLAAGAAFAAGLSAGAASPPPAARSSPPNWSVNRFTTGGSTVEDADLTNSPISLSLARTTLLSTPSSLASSWTRTLATLLLLVRAQGGLRTVSWCACSSRGTHRVLMSCCSIFFSSSRSLRELLHEPGHGLTRDSPVDPEGPGERAATLSQPEARGCGVQMCSPARCPSVRVGDDLGAGSLVSDDDTQQLLLRGSLPATDARAHDTRTFTGHAWALPSGRWVRTAPVSLPGEAPHPETRDAAPRPIDGAAAVICLTCRASPRPPARPAGPRHCGCRCASRSAGQRGGRSAPPCRSRATAGSRAR